MRRFFRRRSARLAAALGLLNVAFAQTKVYTWQELRDRFETTNPTLRAAQLNVSESKAQEITAYLRPNPDFTVLVDQIQPFNGNPYRARGRSGAI